MAAPKLSVVIATYNRPDLLVRLLGQLAKQTASASDYEVVVVDDGGKIEAAPHVAKITTPYSLRLERQANGGAAVARHKGATLARGDVLLFIDDDMQVPEGLIEEHLRIHASDPKAVVLGWIREDESIDLKLFERFHAKVLERFAADVRSGSVEFKGPNVWTGNLSMRRAQYLAVGGFDASLGHSEDAELGVRLEKDGARFYVSDAAYSVHGSDHTSLEAWMKRAYKYGVFDRKIADKHPDVPHANPWRYFHSLNPVSRPLLVATVAMPALGKVLARAAMGVSIAIDKLGAEKIALAGTTLAYGLEYARGLRDASGGLVGAVGGYGAYAEQVGRTSRAALAGVALQELVDGVRKDHAITRHYAEKYGSRAPSREEDLARDLVQKIGFQIMAAYRLMRFFSRARIPLAPKIASRMIRHLYASDIHWDADFDPGVMIVHGMGLAVNGAARVGKGVILFQNVTLGESTDPETRITGAPTVEDDVHIGAGATIVGPVTIGARSKIAAGSFVRHSVPPDSIVSTPEPQVEARVKPRAKEPRAPKRGQA